MSSYDEAREAALGEFVSGDRLREDSETSCNAILDAFLAKLSETHAVVPREALVEKLGIALAQQGHSVSAEGEVTFEDDDGNEYSAPYWRFHGFDVAAEKMIASMLAQEVKP